MIVTHHPNRRSEGHFRGGIMSIIRHYEKTSYLATAFSLVLLVSAGVAEAQATVSRTSEQPGSSAEKQASPDSSEPSSPEETNSRSKDEAGTGVPLKLGTIKVEAQKRLQPLREVPEALTVLSGDRLDRINAVDFGDYLTRVPGVNIISAGAGRTQIVLRGITSGANQPNSTVGTFINNVPFGSSTVYALGGQLAPDIDPAALERITVLKGPQGTLYGSNTLGGLVKFVTRPPDTLHYTARARVDVKSVSDGGVGWGVHATGNAPLVSNTLAVRVHAYKRTDPGYIDDIGQHKEDVNETQVSGGRAELLWTPSDALTLKLSALAQNLTGDGLAANGVNGVDVDPTTLEPLHGDLVRKTSPGTGRFDLRYRLYAANIDARLGWAKFLSTTSYGTIRVSQNADMTKAFGPVLGPALGMPNAGFSMQQAIALNKWTQEFRLQSSSAQKLEWRIGLFYTHEHSTNQQHVATFIATTGQPVNLPLVVGDAVLGPATFTEWAGYGDITWHFTPRFNILLGARYTHERTEYNQNAEGALFGGGLHVKSSSSDDPTTFLINPKYKLTDNSNLYVRVASGFRPGGANVGVPPGLGAPVSFGPDKLVSYALGLKSTLLDRRLAIDVSAFYIDWKQIQLNTFKGGFSFLSNGGKAESQGVEADVTYLPVEGLRLSANATYTDARLTRDTPPGLFGQDGDRLPYVPKWNANFAIDYEFPLAGSWTGFAGGSYRFIGERKADFLSVPAPRFEIPAYRVVDLHLGVKEKGWTIEAYVKNLTDERGITAIGFETTNPVGSPYAAAYVQPRTIGLSVSAGF